MDAAVNATSTSAPDVEALERELTARIDAAADEAALEAVRIDALGKQGLVSGLMRTLGQMSPDERQIMGPKLNRLRDLVAETIAVRKAGFAEAALEAKLRVDAIDVTLPAPRFYQGAIHPISRVLEEMALIFGEMGFTLEEGPDIETDFNNFTALNFPEGHPARDMHDTFFLGRNPANDPNTDDPASSMAANRERKLLRTHTSPVQVRTMLRQPPPIRMICQGRTYRKDSDATHTPMFHQTEGLVIDEKTSMADLKGVLMAFVKAYFEVDAVEVRFRPHYFPFTEPSAEMDVRCDRSGGQIKIGQGDDWLEILGCGMVHPNVIKKCGLDPEKYQGYAFGMGVDRLAGLKYGMPDLRDYFGADVRWLKHYGFSPYLLPGLAQGIAT
ncbi:MAG: phenylalanine--tRNA ligase subunit alpha [Alphaproteobacteria bacterium]|nr:phenylalanine--tRNA ligase subunit alpha [Alphaproteobacteria bacterium]